MRYRHLGRTGYFLDLRSDLVRGELAVACGLERGMRSPSKRCTGRQTSDAFIDTAYAYGQGHSEKLIGRFLRERSESVYVATKIPPHNTQWPAAPDSTLEDVFPPEHIISCTETSLKRLGVECIDLQQFHVWNDLWANQDEWKRAVKKSKKAGKIRYMGISMNDCQPENGMAAADTGLIDSLQVIYNIFEQTPAERLFPYCQQKNLGLIVRAPLDEGGLTGKITPQSTFPEGDWRNRYFSGDRKKRFLDVRKDCAFCCMTA